MGMLFEKVSERNIREKSQELQTSLEKINKEDRLKNKDIDEKIERRDIKDTGDIFGLAKNQPLLALESFKERMLVSKERNSQEILSDFIRYLEVSTRNTSDCWKIDSNFYFKLMDKYYSNDMKFGRSSGSSEFKLDKLSTDLLLRTKGFCFLTNYNVKKDNYINQGDRKSGVDFFRTFFTSSNIPEEMRIDFKNKIWEKDNNALQEYLTIIKKGCDLTIPQLSSLAGIMVGQLITENKKVFLNFADKDLFLKQLFEMGVFFQIFDCALGSELKNQSIKLKTLDLSEDDIWKLKDIADTEQLYWTKSELNRATKSRNPFVTVRNGQEKWDRIKQQEEILFFRGEKFRGEKKKIIGNELTNNFFSKSLHKSFYNEELNSEDFTNNLLLLSTQGDWLSNINFIDKASINKFISNNYGRNDTIEQMYASMILAFPTVLVANFLPSHDINKQKVIDLYLEGNGNLANINKIEDFLTFNITGK